MQLTTAEMRGVLALAAVAALGFMLLAAALEYSRAEGAAEVAQVRADAAAWQVSQLLEEAREITRQAALGDNPP